MSQRQQTVRTFEPTTVERFDDQFWPVLMSLCISATILAATIVTLVAGVWMWVSLMVLPVAITVLLVTLRFIDNRKLRRSFQLAIILSLSAHCLFIIFAKQTDVFHGLLVESKPATTPVRQERVIQVSPQIESLPWQQQNEVPTPEVVEPEPEKQTTVTTTVERPEPTPENRQVPTETAQLERRENTSQTVPRMGKSLSQRSRQTNDAQPRSSESVAAARSTNTAAAASSSNASAEAPELTRRSSPAEASRVSRSRSESRSAAASSSAAPTRSTRSDQPSIRATQPRVAARSSASPARESSTPRANAQAPLAATQPESPRAASRVSDSAKMARRTPNTESSLTRRMQRPQPTSSSTSQMSQRQPSRRAEQPSVVNRQIPDQPTRAATAARSAPASPEMVQRARPSTTSAADTSTAAMNPQPTALSRSTNGTAGAGRTANFDRESGSRQSAAMSASDSMRRRQETSRQRDLQSISLRERATSPRSIAGAEMPSAVNRPDSVAVASSPATSDPSDLSATASAAMTQSNSDARRSNTSVSRGSGSIDQGPTRIVTSESIADRAEGGGQPDINPRAESQSQSRRGDTGAAAPSFEAENVNPVAMDQGGSSMATPVSDTPIESATADQLSRSGGRSADSGAPVRSESQASDRLLTDANESAERFPGRAERASDSDEDDEEEQRRRDQRARDLARSSRRMAGDDAPDLATEIELDSVGGMAAAADGAHEMESGEPTLGQRSDSGSGATATARAERQATGSGMGDAEPDSLARRSGTGSQGPTFESDRTAMRGGRTATRDQAPGLDSGDAPAQVAQSNRGQGTRGQATAEDGISELERSAPPGMALDIDARTGPAGLGDTLESDPGIDSRRASRESPAIQANADTRFRSPEFGGPPAASGAPVVAREAFQNRGQTSRSRSGPSTEAAIELGLAFLARQQMEDGSWTLHGIAQDKSDRVQPLSSDTAATGLAILAFQGAGYNHKEFKYAGQLQSAINWLVEHQKDTGELYINVNKHSDDVCRLYSHGIATLALAEAYGMTQDEQLRLPLQLALDFIADSQEPQKGGWRYIPRSEADTSVSGWMMMAMQSARLAGMETDEKTWRGIERWLRSARSPEQEHLFRYNPDALDRADTRAGRLPSPCMTAVGLLMHLYNGWDRNDPRLQLGAEYIMQHLPSDSTIRNRDTYYWYYATQIIRHVGGETWEKWNGVLYPLLIRTQIQEGPMAGSWDPLNPVPDRFGAHAGRLYVTTMNLLSLEVDYRLLPLHRDTVE